MHLVLGDREERLASGGDSRDGLENASYNHDLCLLYVFSLGACPDDLLEGRHLRARLCGGLLYAGCDRACDRISPR